jgi:hypothetical protein
LAADGSLFRGIRRIERAWRERAGEARDNGWVDRPLLG